MSVFFFAKTSQDIKPIRVASSPVKTPAKVIHGSSEKIKLANPRIANFNTSHGRGTLSAHDTGSLCYPM